jgi:hypothetical protein
MREREMQFPLRVSRDRLDPVLPLGQQASDYAKQQNVPDEEIENGV